jgi:hypothetical protein
MTDSAVVDGDVIGKIEEIVASRRALENGNWLSAWEFLSGVFDSAPDAGNESTVLTAFISNNRNILYISQGKL